MLDGPRIISDDPGPLYFVFVFNDAAHIDFRHGEGLGQDLDAFCLDHRLLKRFAGEFRYLSIRLDGARFQA